MDKKKGLILAELLSILAIANVIIWLIPFKHYASFWIGYFLITIGIVEIGAGKYYSYVGSNIKSRFFNFPLFYIMYVGGTVLSFVGIFFIIFSFIPAKIALSISLIIIIINFVMLVRMDIAREEVSSVDKKVKLKTFYIGNLEQNVKNMIEPGMDVLLKKELEKLAEDIHYSDPMSVPELSSLEINITDECERLSQILSDSSAALESCKKIRRLIQMRNEKCAFLK